MKSQIPIHCGWGISQGIITGGAVAGVAVAPCGGVPLRYLSVGWNTWESGKGLQKYAPY